MCVRVHVCVCVYVHVCCFGDAEWYIFLIMLVDVCQCCHLLIFTAFQDTFLVVNLVNLNLNRSSRLVAWCTSGGVYVPCIYMHSR